MNSPSSIADELFEEWWRKSRDDDAPTFFDRRANEKCLLRRAWEAGRESVKEQKRREVSAEFNKAMQNLAESSRSGGFCFSVQNRLVDSDLVPNVVDAGEK